jgi:MSHA biogenesis protein MshN
MSLVNKMLRDLDARRVGDGERAALPAAVTPLVAHQEPRPVLPRLLLSALGLVALGIAAWYAMPISGRQPSIVAPVVVAPSPDAVPTPLVAAAPATASPAVVAEPAAAAVRSSAPTPVVALPALRMADALVAPPAARPEPTRKPPAAPSKPASPASSVVTAVSPAPTSSPPVAEPMPRPAPVVATKATPAPEALIEKQLRQPSAAERAEAGYRRGLAAARQGLAEDAIGIYRTALADQPEHAAARQALAALLIEARRYDEAEDVLRKGTDIAAARLASTLALARLQVERNQAAAALETLQKHAAAGERSPEYQGFAGALLNRAGRPGEAVAHYQAATRLAPGEGRWWAGLGIALDAAGKGPEARDAYQKARSLPGLPADLAQHVEQRLR